ncbi:hypothetical protein OROHE_008554 [Orobanche hederae]
MIRSGIKCLFASYRGDYFVVQHSSFAPEVLNHNRRVLLFGPANSRKSCLTRCYSSENSEKNAGESNVALTEDVDSQGQNPKEGTEPEKPLSGNETKKPPVLTRGARFRDEFLRRIVPWKEINDSWDTFPYYIQY